MPRPYQNLAEIILRVYISDDATISDTDRLLTGILSTQLELIDLLNELLVHVEERRAAMLGLPYSKS
jgi:hypothetical protein